MAGRRTRVNIVAIVIIIAVLVVYMVYQVFFSHDRGQRGRVFQKLTKYLDATYEMVPGKELRARFTTLGPARVLMARHHLQFEHDGRTIDIIDLRYAFRKDGRNRIVTSTVARFDWDGPAFRSTVEDGVRVTRAPANGPGGAAGGAGVPAPAPDDVVSRISEVEAALGENIVEGDGSQVLLYGWRARLQPDQIPAFKELVVQVADAFTS
jgi:hypothetical protein